MEVNTRLKRQNKELMIKNNSFNGSEEYISKYEYEQLENRYKDLELKYEELELLSKEKTDVVTYETQRSDVINQKKLNSMEIHDVNKFHQAEFDTFKK